MNDLSAIDSPCEHMAVRRVEEELFATAFSKEMRNAISAPYRSSINRDWHADITDDIRQHIVVKLVHTIFPCPDPAAYQAQRIIDLIDYAKRVEKGFVEIAESREEYCHLVAEKIYKIQQQLQGNKAKRLAEAAYASNIPHRCCSMAALSAVDSDDAFETIDDMEEGERVRRLEEEVTELKSEINKRDREIERLNAIINGEDQVKRRRLRSPEAVDVKPDTSTVPPEPADASDDALLEKNRREHEKEIESERQAELIRAAQHRENSSKTSYASLLQPFLDEIANYTTLSCYGLVLKFLGPLDQPSINQNWHADITNHIRQGLIIKIVISIFPSPDPTAMTDQRINDLVQFAKRLEKDFVENADSREEYCHLVAEKICNIQKELREKKEKRLATYRGNFLEMSNQ